MKLLKTVIKELIYHKFGVIATLVIILLGKILSLGGPLILKKLVDLFDGGRGFGDDFYPLAASLVGSYVGILFVSSLLNELKEFLATIVSQSVLTKIGVKIFSDIHAQPIELHIKRQSGIITREIDRGLRGIQLVIHAVAVNFLPAIIEFLLVSIYLAYSYGLSFFLIFLATFVMYVTFNYLVTQRVVSLKKEWNQADSNMSQKLIDSLLNVESVRLFNNEKYEVKRFEFLSELNKRTFIGVQKAFSFLLSGQQLIVCVGLGLVLWKTVINVHDRIMSVGDVVLIISIMSQIFSPLNYLGMLYKDIKQSMVDIERLDEIANINMVDEVMSVDNEVKVNSASEIEFKSVSLCLNGKESKLSNISFKVRGGETTALVGHTGAGKSLIAKLLFGFYKATEGRIFINGQDIGNLDLNSLRKAIAVVPQDISLFNDTIYNNIAYGNLSANRDQVYKVAKSVGLDEFISALPNDYQTVVGERGLLLSGGERQKIAIARAVLKNCPILILDEATSNLDLETERKIYSYIGQTSPKPTVILVAHRLNAITDADQILVLDQGHIIEAGNHIELFAKHGAYRKLWDAQDVP